MPAVTPAEVQHVAVPHEDRVDLDADVGIEARQSGAPPPMRRRAPAAQKSRRRRAAARRNRPRPIGAGGATSRQAIRRARRRPRPRRRRSRRRRGTCRLRSRAREAGRQECSDPRKFPRPGRAPRRPRARMAPARRSDARGRWRWRRPAADRRRRAIERRERRRISTRRAEFGVKCGVSVISAISSATIMPAHRKFQSLGEREGR